MGAKEYNPEHPDKSVYIE